MPKARRRPSSRSERFEDMALPDELLGVLADQGFEHAFEIQSVILPDALAGRDVLARAETGSGKTLAFTLAMTARFRGRKVHRRRPLGVVLVPTRELAVQVVDTIHPFARAGSDLVRQRLGILPLCAVGVLSVGPRPEDVDDWALLWRVVRPHLELPQRVCVQREESARVQKRVDDMELGDNLVEHNRRPQRLIVRGD